jgi:N-acetylglucosaminyl-diphospho-decaprenol L-rhamnosyltransferase
LQLSVIIVNYNVKYFLEQCLYSVVNAIKNIEAEIIVVDNNSSDGSKQFFSNKFDTVQFVWSQHNTGFSKANNIALQQAKGKYILFLNPDTLVPEDCFEKCLSFFETAKNAGAVGVRMINGKGLFLKESKRGFPGLLASFFKLSGFINLFPRSEFFAGYYAGHLSENQNQIVDVSAGAFMMTEKSVLDKTGGFDEDFFMYGEDIDLSYRIQKAGYKNYYFSETTIIHFKGESTKRHTPQYIKIFYGAMCIFVKKHYSVAKAFFYGALIQIVIAIKTAAFFFKSIFFPALPPPKTSITNITQVLVVGGERDYQSVILLLKNTATKLQAAARIDPAELYAGDALSNLKIIKNSSVKHAVENIIFCINELSLKKIIEIMQVSGPSVSYMFYTPGAESIVAGGYHNYGYDDIVTN